MSAPVLIEPAGYVWGGPERGWEPRPVSGDPRLVYSPIYGWEYAVDVLETP